MTKKRNIVENDLYHLKQVSNPQISPDGKRVAYGLHFIDEDNHYISQIHLLDFLGGKSFRQVSAEKSSHSQKWSPDGKRLAFISGQSGTNQIWVYDCTLDHTEQLTTMKNGIESFVWSGDGEKICFLSKSSADEEYANLIKEKTNEELEKEKKDAQNQIKVINKKFYKLDGVGFFDDRIPQVWILDIKNKKYDKITSGDCPIQYLAWSPKEEKIIFIQSMSQDNPEYHPLKSEMWIYDCKKNKLNCLTKGDLSLVSPSFSPNGKKIAYFSHNIEFGEASFYDLWVFDLEKKEKTNLTKSIDMALGNWGLNDVSGLNIMLDPIWDNDGEMIYFAGSHYGNVEIYRISLKGDYEKIISGNRQIGQFSMDSQRKLIAFSYSSPLIPGDISIFDLGKNKENRLTEVNKTLLEELILAQPEEFKIESPTGWDVHGWIMKPANFNSKSKYPAILEIHGGPHLMYANSFFFEFQYLAAAGYVVVYSNPCGSMGYGQEFADVNRGNYGGPDYRDLMAVTDYISQLDYINPKRIGVTGGSYGGYMTNWIVTQTNRFKSAVTQRSISNLFTHAGVSDDGMFTAFIEHKAKLDNMKELYQQSPISYIDRLETPLLIIHSENDYRCPLEQAEQLYNHLKFRGRTTEMVIYPNSSHGLSRNGFPPFRVDRLKRIVGWFDKYNQ